jgi:SAM-dependent methyltransferase
VIIYSHYYQREQAELDDQMPPEFRQSYFDNPEIWNPTVWQMRKTDLDRARLAVEWLPRDAKSVLDVGCGNGVFTNLLETNRFKVGLDLSRIALEHVTAQRLQANATRLPFADDSFDATLCMEMLEHLPIPTYQSALNELVRVARKFILISVPYNENLKFSSVICPVCLCAFHPYYHVRRYGPTPFDTLFSPQSYLVRLEAVVPTKREALPGLWNFIRLYLHRQGKNFPNGVICPQCGYTLVKNAVSIKQVSQPHSMRPTLRHLWPKRTTFTWWMAFYRKGK